MKKNGLLKKGFTMVEVIASIAVFSIAITAAFTITSSSSYTWNKENIDLNMVAYNQCISEDIRDYGKDEVQTMYNLTKNSDGTSYYYIYFNDTDELKSIVTNSLLATNDNTGDDALKSPVFHHLSHTITPSYTDCKSSNTGNKRYGALIHIKNISDASGLNIYYSYYSIESYAWDFQTGPETESVNRFEIGR